MDTETKNYKNILLVEDDLRDVQLTLAALEELDRSITIVALLSGTVTESGRS